MRFFFLFFVFSMASQLMAKCEWKNGPKVIYNAHSPKTKYLVFSEPYNAEFFQTNLIPESLILQQYWQYIAKKNINIDPYELLRNQRAIFAKSAMPDLAKEAKKFDLVINQELGFIRSANCIEWLLFNEHAKNSIEGHVSHEFQANIIINEEKGIINIYFASAENESMAAPSLAIFEEQIRKDLKDGFSFGYTLHNHPFDFDNSYGDIGGTTIPSEADVNNYIMMSSRYGLQKALITNGISTIEIDNSEFEMMQNNVSIKSSFGVIKSAVSRNIVKPFIANFCCFGCSYLSD